MFFSIFLLRFLFVKVLLGLMDGLVDFLRRRSACSLFHSRPRSCGTVGWRDRSALTSSATSSGMSITITIATTTAIITITAIIIIIYISTSLLPTYAPFYCFCCLAR